LPAAIDAQAPILEAKIKAQKARLDKILGAKPTSRQDVGEIGLGMLPKDLVKGLDKDFKETLFGSRVRQAAIKIRLENPDALPEEIEALLKKKLYNIEVGVE